MTSRSQWTLVLNLSAALLQRLCGAYINGDDFHSRLRLLQEQVSSEA